LKKLDLYATELSQAEIWIVGTFPYSIALFTTAGQMTQRLRRMQGRMFPRQAMLRQPLGLHLPGCIDIVLHEIIRLPIFARRPLVSP
jgi:hypothetical protein